MVGFFKMLVVVYYFYEVGVMLVIIFFLIVGVFMKLVIFNLEFFGLDWFDEVVLVRWIEVLCLKFQELEVDILCFQEVNVQKVKGNLWCQFYDFVQLIVGIVYVFYYQVESEWVLG